MRQDSRGNRVLVKRKRKKTLETVNDSVSVNSYNDRFEITTNNAVKIVKEDPKIRKEGENQEQAKRELLQLILILVLILVTM